MGSCQQHREPLLRAVASDRLRRGQLGGVRLRRHLQPLLPLAHRDVHLAGRPAHRGRTPAQPVCLRRPHEAPGDDSGLEPRRQRRSRRTCQEDVHLPVLAAEEAWTYPLHPVCRLRSGRFFHPASLPGAVRRQRGDGRVLARLPALGAGAGRPGREADLRVGRQHEAGEEPAAAHHGGHSGRGHAPAAADQPQLLGHRVLHLALRLPVRLRGRRPRHRHRGHRDPGGLRQRPGDGDALQERRRLRGATGCRWAVWV